ncbi:hypothetical protein [Lysinibacillus sp. K60]|uniref:hypothetical protein n=1 Tax=Lysinibacillus sp. K60 TaxID=2720027 RepID=UPI001C8CB45C|nr:hypothetical protein [Lysinibacillus sp. K60]MBX8946061.1 hypothetical protein [Lysinibacillus sp. K60]
MPLYRIIGEQKITQRVLVVVEADSDEEAMDQARDGNIIAAEKTFDTKIDEFIPLETTKYY